MGDLGGREVGGIGLFLTGAERVLTRSFISRYTAGRR